MAVDQLKQLSITEQRRRAGSFRAMTDPKGYEKDLAEKALRRLRQRNNPSEFGTLERDQLVDTSRPHTPESRARDTHLSRLVGLSLYPGNEHLLDKFEPNHAIATAELIGSAADVALHKSGELLAKAGGVLLKELNPFDTVVLWANEASKQVTTSPEVDSKDKSKDEESVKAKAAKDKAESEKKARIHLAKIKRIEAELKARSEGKQYSDFMEAVNKTGKSQDEIRKALHVSRDMNWQTIATAANKASIERRTVEAKSGRVDFNSGKKKDSLSPALAGVRDSQQSAGETGWNSNNGVG